MVSPDQAGEDGGRGGRGEVQQGGVPDRSGAIRGLCLRRME
jgi:hypothetical protein